MAFATLDYSRIKGGTSIAWAWWPNSRGETLTTIRGCKWAKYHDRDGKAVTFLTCESCYAQKTAWSLVQRFGRKMAQYIGLTKMTLRGPIWTGKVFFDREQLLAVLKMKKPRTFFLTSVGDLFFDGVSDETIALHFAVMIWAHWHRFLILTKRPDRMATLLASDVFRGQVIAAMMALSEDDALFAVAMRSKHAVGHEAGGPKLPRNIWFGTSIEGRDSAAWALEHLIKVNAPGRLWASFEPMIEYADLKPWLSYLSWLVVGGASKQSKAAPWPFKLWELDKIIADCAAAGVAVFIKQFGANPHKMYSARTAGPFLVPKHNNHNADPQHWPEQYRIQQFPEAA